MHFSINEFITNSGEHFIAENIYTIYIIIIIIYINQHTPF